MTLKEQAIAILQTCEDPELHLDVWTLGLIYDLAENNDGSLTIKMTFTSPMCPFGPQIVEDIKTKCASAGIVVKDVDVVFDPPWTPSDDVREMLGV